MERVAFLIERSGERLPCLLNPESLLVRRLAGVQRRRSAGGALTGATRADDPLLYTGGGSTELRLDVLFDVSLVSTPETVNDVRELTAPLWELAENASDDESYGRPPLVRFVWGKSWNVPGVVAAVAERLECFTPAGMPMRSWLRMRFVRSHEPTAAGALEPTPSPFGSPPEVSALAAELPSETEAALAAPAPDETIQVHQFAAGERLDQVVRRYYGFLGHPALWRWLATFNGIADPLHIEPGAVLQIPPLSALESAR
jgi:nucleoid-associated protein YgaU